MPMWDTFYFARITFIWLLNITNSDVIAKFYPSTLFFGSRLLGVSNGKPCNRCSISIFVMLEGFLSILSIIFVPLTATLSLLTLIILMIFEPIFLYAFKNSIAMLKVIFSFPDLIFSWLFHLTIIQNYMIGVNQS